jgi:beta-glucanase (GH16 family)
MLMPRGCGITSNGGQWPSLWLLGSNCQATNLVDPDNVGTCSWPNSGSDEIDIVEFGALGTAGTSGVTNYNVGTFQNGGQVGGPTNVPVSDASVNWHEYRCDWRLGNIEWFLDGVSVNSTGTAPSTPMFILINISVAGTPNASMYPAEMLVDYVQVFNS